MKALVVAAFLIACIPATAQVNKCKGPGGKIVYSDGPCDSGSAGQRLTVHQNAIDASGDRRAAQAYRESADIDALMQNPPSKCQFEGKSGKRQELAERAKQECVRNAVAERSGGATSNDAQQAYRDNEEHRRRLMEAAAASGGRRSTLCTSMGPGMMSCK